MDVIFIKKISIKFLVSAVRLDGIRFFASTDNLTPDVPQSMGIPPGSFTMTLRETHQYER